EKESQQTELNQRSLLLDQNTETIQELNQKIEEKTNQITNLEKERGTRDIKISSLQAEKETIEKD
ncbi:9560_t:CDS:1, partial [Racocetra persica]